MTATTVQPASRWDRLAADLAAAGFQVTVDVKQYTEDRRGRVHHGSTRSVRMILPDGRHITICDGWWSKNPDYWIGWQVWLEAPDGITLRTWRYTKKRGEVVAAVQTAVAG